MDKFNKSYTVEYTCWKNMIDRCTNPKNKAYRRYGGRGITVCQSWLESFDNFFLDMGLRPPDKNSIDRIDNDGNYEKSNCRWSDPAEQASNKNAAAAKKHLEYLKEKKIHDEHLEIVRKYIHKCFDEHPEFETSFDYVFGDVVNRY